jgi:uncharacterized protein (DUF58 family)
MATGSRATESRLREDAATLAARLPSLVIAARRIAQSVMHGVHGRRQAGPGETFWQFRPFISGEPAARVDWRRSARENRAFVREREWEAAHTLWLWFDRSASMDFGSALAPGTKLDRAAILTLALADLAVRGGERVGLLGLTRPIATRAIIDRFAEILAVSERTPGSVPAALPPPEPIASRSKVVLIGDFLSPAGEIANSFAALGAPGVEGQAMMISDPIEETFPFSGHTEFLQAGGELRFRTPRAQNLRSAYLARLAAQRESVRAACAGRGWDLALHRTDQSAAGALLGLTARLSQRGPADFARDA